MKNLERILALCVDEVIDGRSSAEEVLGHYPEIRSELEPLLRIALRIPAAPDVRPSPEFINRSRLALQSEMARPGLRTRFERALSIRATKPSGLVPRLVTALAMILIAFIVLMVGGSGVVYASQEALPGDVLYPVKTTAERVRLLVIFSPSGKAAYHWDLAETRLIEVISLSQSGRRIKQEHVEAIAFHLDSMLTIMVDVPRDDALNIFDEISAEFPSHQIALRDARDQAGINTEQLFVEAELLLGRGLIFTELVAKGSDKFPPVGSVLSVKRVEFSSTVSSLSPLLIAGVLVETDSDSKIEGVLILGGRASVTGEFVDEMTIFADSIKVIENSEPSRIEITGAISALSPLRIANFTVIPPDHFEIAGANIIGLIAEVEGTLLEDGIVLASRIEVESLLEILKTPERAPENAPSPQSEAPPVLDSVVEENSNGGEDEQTLSDNEISPSPEESQSNESESGPADDGLGGVEDSGEDEPDEVVEPDEAERDEVVELDEPDEVNEPDEVDEEDEPDEKDEEDESDERNEVDKPDEVNERDEVVDEQDEPDEEDEEDEPDEEDEKDEKDEVDEDEEDEPDEQDEEDEHDEEDEPDEEDEA